MKKANFALIFAGMLMSLALSGSAARADRSAPLDTILPSGVHIIVQRDSSTSLVSLQVFIKAGATEESDSNSGIGTFVASTLLKGTTNYSEDAIQNEIGRLGGNMSAIWQPDMTRLKVLTLATQFDEAAHLTCDVLQNAAFTDASVEETRHDLLANIQAQSDDLYQQTYNQARSALYAGTPYARSSFGDVNAINKITAQDLRDYYNQYYTPDRIVIVAVGNINPDHVEKILDAELDNFPRKASRSSSPVPNIIVTPMTKPVIVKRFRDDLNAGYVMVGYLAPGAGDKDYPEMLVINALLGGMKSSLMFENVREKLGLGYEVASVYPNQLAISDIVGYDVTAPTKEDPETKKSASVLPQVQEALLAQFHELTVTPPTADDLARAKRYLIGSYLIAHEQLEDRAFYLGYSEIALRSIGGYRFDTNYADAINAITAADVQRVAQQYFGGNGYVVSMLMPQENDPDVIKE